MSHPNDPVDPLAVAELPPPSPRTLRLTLVMLLVWFLASFGFAFFARDLDVELFGWPFSFWMAAQGAPVVYVLITAVYAALANRLEARHERETSPGGPD